MLHLVSVEDNDRLLQSIQDSEIKEAIFEMDKFKAPRPDGFGAASFQDYRHIVKEKVCTVVRSFFEEGKLLKQINHTLMALIPKVSNPTTTNQFRAISFCNTIYKIISKIIANRMPSILEKIIDLI